MSRLQVSDALNQERESFDETLSALNHQLPIIESKIDHLTTAVTDIELFLELALDHLEAREEKVLFAISKVDKALIDSDQTQENRPVEFRSRPPKLRKALLERDSCVASLRSARKDYMDLQPAVVEKRKELNAMTVAQIALRCHIRDVRVDREQWLREVLAKVEEEMKRTQFVASELKRLPWWM
ncbi:Ff.00g040480.m01.CDS01 [Fusarium sp. VM40]|nr:Ff.00g040480.m01.CDS01 [Fusarium sp. VM40]